MAVEGLHEAYIALLYKPNKPQWSFGEGDAAHLNRSYMPIRLTFRDESGDHAGTAIVPTRFEYENLNPLVIDGTGYSTSDYNILGNFNSL